MSGSATRTIGRAGTQDDTRTRITRDLLLLADLHDHEPDREAVVALWSRCYDGLLEAAPFGPALRDAINRFCDSLTEIPTCFDATADDALLADFRHICVTANTYRESHQRADCDWDEQYRHVQALALHQRASTPSIAAGSGLWADGAGLASQLRHLAYLVAENGVAAPADTLEQYLENHLLLSVDRFAAGVAAHNGTHFYQQLGLLTAAYVHELAQWFSNGVLESQRSPDRRPPAPELAKTADLQNPRTTTAVSWDGQREA